MENKVSSSSNPKPVATVQPFMNSTSDTQRLSNTSVISYSDEEDKVKCVFRDYDENRDGVLDYEEFSSFLKGVFHSNLLTDLPEAKLKKFMLSLDSNKDGLIDMTEFKHAWSHCFKKVLNPVTALVIVDVQYDFIDGSLALRNCPAGQDGAEVVPVINRILDETNFDLVIYSLDWHPDSHISFISNVDKYPIKAALHACNGNEDNQAVGKKFSVYDEVEFELSPPRAQVLWPAHCIQGSDGAKLDKNLKIAANSVNVYKGMKTDIDSYSAFFDNMRLSQTALHEELTRRDVTDVYICGLAYDVCVAATTRDAVDLGFRTVVIDDACRGVSTENIEKSKRELQDLGALILNSDDVVKLVNKEVCSLDMGLFAAQTMPESATTNS